MCPGGGHEARFVVRGEIGSVQVALGPGLHIALQVSHAGPGEDPLPSQNVF